MNKTALYNLHRESGAKMVPFAGYDMPLHYTDGIINEHLHTRSAASLFDVSHMGQIEISGPHAQAELEKLLPVDLDTITISEMVYSFLPNAQGGVIDDLIITRRNRDNFVLVVNAACKGKVIHYLSQNLATSPLHILSDQALLALQGPQACAVLERLVKQEVANLHFMQGMLAKFDRIECFVSRAGYTGEDGFEISLPTKHAEKLAQRLLAVEGVRLAGLGARDTLRLEAGLCLYGHELGENISPIAAGIGWTISKTRRHAGRKAGNFVGSELILAELQNGTAQQRVGLKVQGKVPVRDGAILFANDRSEVGKVSSGSFSPTLGSPVAMAFVKKEFSQIGTLLKTQVRGQEVALEVSALPFVAHHYYRG